MSLVLGGCPAPSARRIALGQGRPPAIRTGEVATRLLFHLILWSLLWSRHLDAEARPPSIHPFRSASPSLGPATPFSMPITHVFMPVALSRSAYAHLCHARPHAVTIRWRSPCDTRFAPPHQSRPVRRPQWGAPCPTQVAGAGHAQGPAAQWWWAHGGPAGVIGGKNCTNGK